MHQKKKKKDLILFVRCVGAMIMLNFWEQPTNVYFNLRLYTVKLLRNQRLVSPETYVRTK